MNIETVGGRRFILTAGCGAVCSVLLWFGKLTDQRFYFHRHGNCRRVHCREHHRENQGSEMSWLWLIAAALVLVILGVILLILNHRAQPKVKDHRELAEMVKDEPFRWDHVSRR